MTVSTEKLLFDQMTGSKFRIRLLSHLKQTLVNIKVAQILTFVFRSPDSLDSYIV